MEINSYSFAALKANRSNNSQNTANIYYGIKPNIFCSTDIILYSISFNEPIEGLGPAKRKKSMTVLPLRKKSHRKNWLFSDNSL